jgi:DNA-binding protein H-NS
LWIKDCFCSTGNAKPAGESVLGLMGYIGTFLESRMAKADLRNMDVDGLLELRAEVDRALTERARDLERQIALLGGGEVKRRGRPPKTVGRESALKGKTVPPKYRGPNGETWAGRGAMPRWLSALLKEGHSVEEFLIGGGKRRPAAPRKKVANKKVAKTARKPRRPKRAETTAEPAAA